MTWSCPCGCALQLSARDLGLARWVDSLSGGSGSAFVPAAATPQRPDAPEQAYELQCGRCRRPFSILVYLGEFMLAHVGKAMCPDCARGNHA